MSEALADNTAGNDGMPSTNVTIIVPPGAGISAVDYRPTYW